MPRDRSTTQATNRHSKSQCASWYTAAMQGVGHRCEGDEVKQWTRPTTTIPNRAGTRSIGRRKGAYVERNAVEPTERAEWGRCRGQMKRLCRTNGFTWHLCMRQTLSYL